MSVEELQGDALREILRTESRGVLIDFWSPWCAPCRTLRPHLRKLADAHAASWRVVAIDTEAHPSVAEAYRVASVPTLVWTRHGREVARLAGAVTVASIAARFDELEDAGPGARR